MQYRVESTYGKTTVEIKDMVEINTMYTEIITIKNRMYRCTNIVYTYT